MEVNSAFDLWIITLFGLLQSCLSVYNSSTGYSYDFVQDPCQTRTINPGMDGRSLYGFIRPRKEGAYQDNKTCSIKIQAPKYERLVIRFRKIDIYKTDKACVDQDAVIIEGNSSNMVFCGKGTPSYSILSSSDFLTVKLLAGYHDFENKRIGFELYYTVFHDGDCQTGSQGHEFRCRSEGRCIPRELKCDGYDNCGDWSDESVATCGLSTTAIITTSIICALVGGSCIGFAGYYCYNKVKQRNERTRRANEISPTMTAEYAAENGGQTTIHIQSGNTVVNVNGATARENQYAEPPPPYTYTSMGLYDPKDTERDPDAPPAYDNSMMTLEEPQPQVTVNEAAVNATQPQENATETVSANL